MSEFAFSSLGVYERHEFNGGAGDACRACSDEHAQSADETRKQACEHDRDECAHTNRPNLRKRDPDVVN